MITPITSDHPRSRGVYAAGFVERSKMLGSSPLARGLQGRLEGGSGLFRIIPARAGFTNVCSYV